MLQPVIKSMGVYVFRSFELGPLSKLIEQLLIEYKLTRRGWRHKTNVI